MCNVARGAFPETNGLGRFQYNSENKKIQQSETQFDILVQDTLAQSCPPTPVTLPRGEGLVP
eukprot:6478856-Amphidinium_carterae.2